MAVEQEMRLTLAKLLAQAVKDIAEFRSLTLDQQAFMLWVDKYQAQLVVLASQIRSVMWQNDYFVIIDKSYYCSISSHCHSRIYNYIGPCILGFHLLWALPFSDKNRCLQNGIVCLWLDP